MISIFIHSVQMIVALITVRANMGMCAYVRWEPRHLSMCTTGIGMLFFYPARYFNVRALIFPKFLQVKNCANQLNMQKNLVLIFLTMKATIFDTHGSYLCYQQSHNPKILY